MVIFCLPFTTINIYIIYVKQQYGMVQRDYSIQDIPLLAGAVIKNFHHKTSQDMLTISTSLVMMLTMILLGPP
ncbi:MAG: uncharacterized membrane protein YsdA (DUF1294 family) [Bacillariaceae sp.]|jgi:uncharacterized membrane protein YsdA (DUF1294 family)